MSSDLPHCTSLLWTNSDAPEDQPSLIRLSPTSLTLVVVPASDLDKVVTSLKNGEEVAAQVIPLATINDAGAPLDEAELTVNFTTGPSKREDVTLPFADISQRDEFVAALLGALGPEWHEHRRPESRWSSNTFWMVLGTVLLALATWGLYAEARLIAEGKKPVNWGRGGKLRVAAAVAHWLEAKIGPTGVLLLGSSLTCLCAAVVVHGLFYPGGRVVVERLLADSPSPQSSSERSDAQIPRSVDS